MDIFELVLVHGIEIDHCLIAQDNQKAFSNNNVLASVLENWHPNSHDMNSMKFVTPLHFIFKRF